MLSEVIGCARTFPIRVAGNSGGAYRDQLEISWADLGQEPELTTVTKKVRRVFTFSDQQIREAIWECQPTRIFLNFINYLKNGKEIDDLVGRIDHIAKEEECAGRVTWAGCGPKFSDVVAVTLE